MALIWSNTLDLWTRRTGVCTCFAARSRNFRCLPSGQTSRTPMPRQTATSPRVRFVRSSRGVALVVAPFSERKPRSTPNDNLKRPRRFCVGMLVEAKDLRWSGQNQSLQPSDKRQESVGESPLVASIRCAKADETVVRVAFHRVQTARTPRENGATSGRPSGIMTMPRRRLP